MRICKTALPTGTGERGFVLVPVLWILLVLATLAGVLSVYLSNSATALALNDDRLRSVTLASSSLELTAYKLLSVAKAARPLGGSFFFDLNHARVFVEFSSESSRIDLNHAPKELLVNLFQVLGAPPKDAAQYAERIVGWRSPPPEDNLESENSLYRAAGVLYTPRGAPFQTVQELWLVLGLPPALVERMLQFVTVFSGRREINAFEAAPEVVASLPGMTPSTLDIFLKERQALPRDTQSLNELLAAAHENVSLQGSEAVLVTARFELENGRQSAAEVVILLDGGEDPYRILSWRDDGELAMRRRPREAMR